MTTEQKACREALRRWRDSVSTFVDMEYLSREQHGTGVGAVSRDVEKVWEDAWQAALAWQASQQPTATGQVQSASRTPRLIDADALVEAVYKAKRDCICTKCMTGLNKAIALIQQQAAAPSDVP